MQVEDLEVRRLRFDGHTGKDGEMAIEVLSKYGGNYTWINRDEAAQLVKHLIAVFDLEETH